MSYEHILRAAGRLPWAILPEKLDEIIAFLELKAQGGSISPEAIEQYAATPARTQAQQGAVAVIPIYGVVAQRMNLMTAMSGGTSIEQLTSQFRDAIDNPNVSAIVFDVDSPGGSVFGVDELASEIRASRGQKPIVAVANSLMASAAYWLSSGADEIVGTPSGQIGSIGVLAMHVDNSEANAQQGLRPTVVSAGKYKAELSDTAPLTEEAQAFMQEQVNQYYDAFIGAVADGRGVSRDAVRSGYGQGRVLLARQAVRAGLADRLGTLEQTITRLQTPQGRSAVLRQAAEVDRPPIEAETSATLAPTKRELERALRDAGLSQSEAKAFISRAWDSDARDVPEEIAQQGTSLDLLTAGLDLLVATL